MRSVAVVIFAFIAQVHGDNFADRLVRKLMDKLGARKTTPTSRRRRAISALVRLNQMPELSDLDSSTLGKSHPDMSPGIANARAAPLMSNRPAQPLMGRTTSVLSRGSQSTNAGALVFQPDSLAAFVDVLRAHCNDDSLIKGWEADRRICVGRDRAALRAAARDVRQKAFKTNGIASAKANVSKTLSRQEWLYVQALQTLETELAKAKESDFDSMLKDGLEWLEEHLGFKAKNLKCVTASVYDRVGRDLLRRLKEQRASGHRGKAIDRDLRHATVLHGELCKAWALVDDSEASQLAYLGATEAFLVELAKAGEPDFDGKLRQAINYLEHGGERLCF